MIEPLGWHTVVYSEADILQEMIPFLEAIPTIIVVDHLGRPDMPRDRGGADIKAFNLLLNSHSNIWTKVSGAERLSPMGPPYDDFVEVILPVVGHFFDHVFWGGGRLVAPKYGTSHSRRWRACRQSNAAALGQCGMMVPAAGIEPATSSLQNWRSTN